MKLENILEAFEIEWLRAHLDDNLEESQDTIKAIDKRISKITDFAYEVLEAKGNTTVTAQEMQNIFDSKWNLLNLKCKIEKAQNIDINTKINLANNIINLTKENFQNL